MATGPHLDGRCPEFYIDWSRNLTKFPKHLFTFIGGELRYCISSVHLNFPVVVLSLVGIFVSIAPALAQIVTTIADTVDAPGGIAVDRNGIIYFADNDNFRVRRLDPRTKTIVTVAGNGRRGFSGDGGPATSASFDFIGGLAIDSRGNLYISCTCTDPASASNGGRVRRVEATSGIISTFAGGSGVGGIPAGASVPATQSGFARPTRIVFDSKNNLYIADYGTDDLGAYAGRIYRVDGETGLISVYAGGGDGSGTSSSLVTIRTFAIAVGPDNAVFYGQDRVFRIDPITKNVSRYANVSASSLVFDPNGNLFVAERNTDSGFIRRVDGRTGVISTVGGGLDALGPVKDGNSATSGSINANDLAIDPTGNLVASESFQINRLMRITLSAGPPGTFTTSTTIASTPTGLTVIVDGVAVTTPQNFNWVTGSTHILDVPSPQGAAATRYAFDKWSNGGAKSQQITATAASTNLTATFTPQHRLTTRVNPTGAGSLTARPTSTDGYYNQGTSVQLTAAPSGGFGFVSYTGDLSGTANPQSITLSAPKSIAANFASTSQLQVDAARVEFSFAAGTTAPFSRTVNLTSNAASLTVTARTAEPWLTVSPVTTTPPNSVVISLRDPRSLAAGTYNGTVVFSAPGTNDLVLPVRVVVSPAPSGTVSFFARPSSLEFAFVIDGQAPKPQFLAIDSSSAGASYTIAPVTLTPATGARWLDVDVRTANAGRSLSVTARPGAGTLTPGNFEGELRMTPEGATVPSLVVPVRLVVTAPVPNRLDIEQTDIRVQTTRSEAAQQSQILVRNPGLNLISFAAQVETDDGAKWLSVSKREGAVSRDNFESIVVRTDPTGLEPGLYTGRVVVNRPSSADQPSVVIPVAMTVARTALRMLVNPPSLSLQFNEDQELSRTIRVSTRGNGRLNWSAVVTQGAPWLRLESASGAILPVDTQDLVIKVDPRLVPADPGEYHGLIQVSSPDAANATEPIAITVRRLSSGDTLAPYAIPAGLTFVTSPGRNPVSQTTSVTFRNLPAGGLGSYQSQRLEDPENTPDWLRMTGSLTFPRFAATVDLVVRPVVDGLAAGVYSRIITVTAGRGVLTIPVLLVISEGAGATTAGNKNVRRAGCQPTRYLPLFNSINDEFTTELGSAVTTELVIVDNCGNLVNDSSVASTLSNRDRAYDLQSLGDGRWRASWVPRRDTASATINVNTADPTLAVPDALTSARSFIRGATDGPIFDSAKPITNAVGDRLLFVSPGSRISIRGRRLATAAATSEDPAGDLSLAKVSVTLGDRVLRLLSVAPEEIQLLIPDDLPVNTQLSLVVSSSGLLSAPEPVLVGVR